MQQVWGITCACVTGCLATYMTCVHAPVCLQDTIKACREAASPSHSPHAGSAGPDQAAALGWYPHGRPFLWPAPRDPASYNTHPLKPSEYRYVQVQVCTLGVSQTPLPSSLCLVTMSVVITVGAEDCQNVTS